MPRLTVLIDELIAPPGSKLTYTLYGPNRKTELPITFTIPSNSVDKIPRAIVSIQRLFKKLCFRICILKRVLTDYFIAKFGIIIRSIPYWRYHQVIRSTLTHKDDLFHFRETFNADARNHRLITIIMAVRFRSHFILSYCSDAALGTKQRNFIPRLVCYFWHLSLSML